MPRRLIAIMPISALAVAMLVSGIVHAGQPNNQAPNLTQLRSASAAERSAAAAEQSAKNTSRSADAASLSADAAKSSADTARKGLSTARMASVLSFLALLGPYFIIWINAKRERNKAAAHQRNLDDAGRRMITDACTAIETASSRHTGTSLGVGELWKDLSKLSGQRNVLKVYMEAGEVSHDLLMGISEALQVNFATRDALIMRDPAGTSNAPNQQPNPARSDAVLQDVVVRTGDLRKILETLVKTTMR